MHFGTYSLLLLVAAANGMLLAALLLLPAGKHPGSRALAALVAAIALRIVPYVLGFAGAYDAYPALTFAPFDLTLAWGPLLWIYVGTLATGTPPHHRARHLIPAALQLTYQLVCFALPTSSKWQWYSGPHLRVVEPLGTFFVLVSLGAYSVAAWRTYEQWQRWLDQNVSNREESRLGWLRIMLFGIAGTGILGAVMMMVHIAVRPLDYFARLPIIVVLAGLTYLVGLLGFRFGRGAIAMRTADPPEQPAPDAEVADARGASRDYAVQADVWRALIIAQRWHHDPMLTLTSLAAALGTSPRTLSRTLNEGLGLSFNTFVNGLRVRDAVERLRQSDAPGVLRVAMDVGFSSKASFNRAFRIHTGTTPTNLRGVQMPAEMVEATSQLPPKPRLASHESSE
jgi:AraC-like DNA-binding protein